MIAFLSGQLKRKAADHVVILTQGVGYQVHVASRQIESLPEEGAEIELEVVTVVREDEITLYGFIDVYEARFFSALLDVSGVGPKTALNILTQSSWENLFLALRSEDIAKVRGLKGIGEKTARLMLLGLKKKILEFQEEWDRRHNGGEASASNHSRPGMLQDVEKALAALGYTRADIRNTLSRIDVTPETPLQVVIKKSLQILSGHVPGN